MPPGRPPGAWTAAAPGRPSLAPETAKRVSAKRAAWHGPDGPSARGTRTAVAAMCAPGVWRSVATLRGVNLTPVATAELLAVGSELLTGDTRDTNSADLAAELTALGVEVARMSQLPDELPIVVGALRDALSHADLVLTTGGLGPTPDDLTREAIAEVMGESPSVDPDLLAWLRDLFARRGIRFADTNLKQAWLIPSAVALPNPNGTAPGWFVRTPDGRLIVALPGPPREMRPMWQDHVLPRLRERGLGLDRAVETLRLTGIGESLLVDLVGEGLLRAAQPRVGTYARPDAVDLRISAVGEEGRPARSIVDAAIAALMPRLEPFLFARGSAGWPQAIGARLGGRSVALLERGLAGQLTALLGAESWLRRAEVLPARARLPHGARDLRTAARHARDEAGADVGLAVQARERPVDTEVAVAVALGRRTTLARHRVFLAGDQGRRRAANAACSELWACLGAAARRAPPGA